MPRNIDPFRMCGLGIDPGATGGWAIVSRGGQLVAFGKYKQELKAPRLAMFNHPVRVLLEKQHARPGCSVWSTSSLMRNYGEWRGLLWGIGLPFDELQPAAWQKLADVHYPKGTSHGEHKEMGYRLAQSRYPGVKFPKYIADAILIAGAALLLPAKKLQYQHTHQPEPVHP